MARALALTLLLLGTALAGCLGSEDGGDADDQTLQRQRADVTAELGGVQGVVTDTAVQPVVGANVTLVELDQTTKTAADGSFAFSKITPGTYTLSVRRDGFVSASETVLVAANKVATVDFILAHLASEEAYTQAIELVGFFECGWNTGWNISQLPPPANYFFLGLAACGAVNLITETNATNDRFLHYTELEPPIDTLVYEMTWTPQSQFSEILSTNVEIAGFPNDAIGRFVLTNGPSPIQVRVDKDTWTGLDEDFRTACEEGSEAYCGYNFWDQGWPLQTRVFPAWECLSENAGGCVALQQEFTHILTAFYNAPAPEAYTALSG